MLQKFPFLVQTNLGAIAITVPPRSTKAGGMVELQHHIFSLLQLGRNRCPP
jgi:hypothetical protein